MLLTEVYLILLRQHNNCDTEKRKTLTIYFFCDFIDVKKYNGVFCMYSNCMGRHLKSGCYINLFVKENLDKIISTVNQQDQFI